MLYHFLNSLLAISSVGGYLMLLAAVAFVGMFVYLGLTNLFRILMGGLLVLEAYQMSASFACNGSNFLFQRAPAPAVTMNARLPLVFHPGLLPSWASRLRTRHAPRIHPASGCRESAERQQQEVSHAYRNRRTPDRSHSRPPRHHPRQAGQA